MEIDFENVTTNIKEHDDMQIIRKLKRCFESVEKRKKSDSYRRTVNQIRLLENSKIF